RLRAELIQPAAGGDETDLVHAVGRWGRGRLAVGEVDPVGFAAATPDQPPLTRIARGIEGAPRANCTRRNADADRSFWVEKEFTDQAIKEVAVRLGQNRRFAKSLDGERRWPTGTTERGGGCEQADEKETHDVLRTARRGELIVAECRPKCNEVADPMLASLF